MSSGTRIAIGFLLAALVGTGVVWWRQRAQEASLAEAARAEAEARQERAARRAVRDRERIVEESKGFLPEGLGVALTMTRAELEAARPGARPTAAARETGMSWLQEQLENGAEVRYGIDDEGERLVEVQILSSVPDPDVLGEHLRRLNLRHGRPTGVVDCPTPGAVPTRRFLWVGEHLTLSDVLVVLGRSISITMKLEPKARAAAALRQAACQAVSGEALARMPVATPEQIQRALASMKGGAAAVPGARRPVDRPELPAAYR